MLKWTPNNIKKFILACRRDEGIPMFRSKYAGISLTVNNKPAVIAVCWAGRGETENSELFTEVTKDDTELIERNTGDWRLLLNKYGTKDEIKEAEKYGIYIKGYRLPKIKTG